MLYYGMRGGVDLFSESLFAPALYSQTKLEGSMSNQLTVHSADPHIQH